MKCSQCGAEGSGNYCARCGAPLAAGDDGRCPSCGADLQPDAYFCTECGEPVRERADRGASDYLPWVLSGLALVAFAVGITLLVMEQSAPRQPGTPPTGGVIEGGDAGAGSGTGGGARPGGGSPGAMPGGGSAGGTGEATAPDAGGGGGGQGGMPSAQELSRMGPREAGDRLFNRAMRMAAAGDTSGRAPFFARMGVRAYRRVPPSRVDADLRFHMGLLELVRDDPAAAAAEADSILQEHPAHLLGLHLAARAAAARGDSGAAGRWRDSLRAAAGRTSLDARPEYRVHRTLLEQAVGEGAGAADAGD